MYQRLFTMAQTRKCNSIFQLEFRWAGRDDFASLAQSESYLLNSEENTQLG